MTGLHALTITVKPFKNINDIYTQNKKLYKSASKMSQYAFVDKTCKTMFEDMNLSYTIVSEEHKNQALHYHGMVICTVDQASMISRMLNSYVGRSECILLKSHTDVIKWNKYIHKENGMFTEQGRNDQTWSHEYEMYKHCAL